MLLNLTAKLSAAFFNAAFIDNLPISLLLCAFISKISIILFNLSIFLMSSLLLLCSLASFQHLLLDFQLKQQIESTRDQSLIFLDLWYFDDIGDGFFDLFSFHVYPFFKGQVSIHTLLDLFEGLECYVDAIDDESFCVKIFFLRGWLICFLCAFLWILLAFLLKLFIFLHCLAVSLRFLQFRLLKFLQDLFTNFSLEAVVDLELNSLDVMLYCGT